MAKRKGTKGETITDLQNITQKTKDQATRTLQKPGLNSGAPEGLDIACIMLNCAQLF